MSIRWIFKKDAEKFDFCVFRKDLFIESADEITAEISSLDRFYLYVNGNLASRGPVKSYNFSKFYDRVDITKFAVKGKNSILILSQFADGGGVYARILQNGKTILETDETWKTKKYEALDNQTEAKCPPLEPVRLNEECFDARKDFDILSNAYDFSHWENAVCVHPEWNKIVLAKGGAESGKIIYPEKFMGALAVGEKTEFAFRLRNPEREANEVRKCAGEIYFFAINSKESCELEFLSGNVEKCSLNGEIITDKARLKKGENLFAAYYFNSDADPYFVFKNTKNLEFSEIKTESGKHKAAVLKLKPDGNFYGWAYIDKSAYKDSDGEAVIASALSLKTREELVSLAPRLISADVCDTSVSYDIIEARFGKISGIETDASLKIKTDFTAEACQVTAPENIINGGAEYASIAQNTALFFDFGSEKLGYLKFTLTASEGTVIDFMGFEVVDFNGAKPMAKNCMRYICREGEQSFTSFYKRGMRYLCLIVRHTEAPVKISSVSLESASLNLPESASFECDDETINQIYSMCLNTAELCMSDTYVDCPGYEQVFWVNDAKVTSEINLSNFAAYDYDYRCLSLIAESLSDEYKRFYRNDKAYKENKHLTTAAFGSYVYGGFPLASFHWGLGVCDYYLYSGDTEGTKKLYPSLKKMLSNCENMMSSRGLFAMEGSWNLIEWAKNDLFPCGEVTANSALLSKLYKSCAILACDFGDAEYAAYCMEKSRNIAEAINKYCWNEELGAYVDTVRDEYGYELYLKFFKENGLEYEDFEAYKSYSRISEQTNVIVKFCDLVTPEREARVKLILTDILCDTHETHHSQPIENILDKERKQADVVRIGTPFLLYYFFKVLAGYKEYEGMLKIMHRFYGFMIECGTDTCWETFYNPGSEEWTRSICHGWAASPAIYLLSEIVGIKPKAPGFKEFSFEPNSAYLKQISAKIPTPSGFIRVEIDKENNISKIDYPKECKLV